MAGSSPSRPRVAVIVPFYGGREDAAELAAALGALRLAAGDEVVVADNTEDGRFDPGLAGPPVRVVRAPLERSSYYARNVAVEASSADWLLFLDSDCRPAPDVADRYFEPPPDDREGILSGAVVAAAGQTALTARYASSRGHIDPAHYRVDHRRHAGITANLLVRRAAWDAVGGFQEGVRSGADLEFCWRVQDAGFAFGWRPDAVTEHVHVETLRKLVRKTVRHAGGGGWVNRRYPGAFPRPRLAYGIGKALVGLLAWPLLAQPRRGLFKGIDGLFLACDAYGRLTGNGAWRDRAAPAPAAPAAVLVLGTFAAGEPVEALARAAAAHRELRVEALARPWTPARAPRRAVWSAYEEDHGPLERARDLLALLVRRPAALAAAAGLGPRAALAAAPAARRLHDRGDGPVLAVAGDAGEPAARALARLGGTRLQRLDGVAPAPAPVPRSASV
jgi:GT2 family glycosyltransferase